MQIENVELVDTNMKLNHNPNSYFKSYSNIASHQPSATSPPAHHSSSFTISTRKRSFWVILNALNLCECMWVFVCNYFSTMIKDRLNILDIKYNIIYEVWLYAETRGEKKNLQFA